MDGTPSGPKWRLELRLLAKDTIEDVEKYPYWPVEALDGVVAVPFEVREEESLSRDGKPQVETITRLERKLVESLDFDSALTETVEGLDADRFQFARIENEGISICGMEGPRAAATQIFRLQAFPRMVGRFGTIVAIPSQDLVYSIPIDDRTFTRHIPSLAWLANSRYDEESSGGPRVIYGVSAVSPRIYLLRDGHIVEVPYDSADGSIRTEGKLTSLFQAILSDIQQAGTPN